MQYEHSQSISFEPYETEYFPFGNSAKKAIQARMTLEMLVIDHTRDHDILEEFKNFNGVKAKDRIMGAYASLDEYLAWRWNDVGAK